MHGEQAAAVSASTGSTEISSSTPAIDPTTTAVAKTHLEATSVSRPEGKLRTTYTSGITVTCVPNDTLSGTVTGNT